MVDATLARLSPLHSYVERFTSAGQDHSVRLRELPFVPMTDFRAWDGEAAPPSVPGGSLLRLGPGWWLHVGPPAASGGVDVSAHRTTLELSGPRGRDVLMTGCSLDLHPSVFVVGACAQTLVAQAQVVLHRTAPDTYRLLVRASFARYLADWLLDAMLEYGEAG